MSKMVTQESAIWKANTDRKGWDQRALRSKLRTLGIILIILPGALMFLAPFLWMLSTSLKEAKYVYLFPPQIIPEPVRWANYPEALTWLPFHLYAVNTVYITVLSLIGQILTASLCAFGFARLRFPGRDAWFLVLLSTIMLPAQVTLIPTFLIFRYLGWIDTYKPLIIPFWLGGGAFSIFLLRQFISTIPLELDDAAKIDGCSYFDIFWRITLPLIKPALVTVAIFGFLHHWNDFYYPVIFINTQNKWTLALGLNFLRRANETPGINMDMELIMAAAVVIMIPPLLVFFFAQKYFIQGIVFSGVKG